MNLRHIHRSWAATAIASAALLVMPGIAAAQLGSCAALLTAPPLAGNPAVFSATSVEATTAGRAYCNVSVVWRDPALVGEAAGYAPGDGPPVVNSYQHVRMGFSLPANTNEGDAAWGGRLVQTSGGGDQGSVAGTTSYVGLNPAAIGVSTDSGHGTPDSGDASVNAYGYVQGVRPNYGKLKDWGGGRSYCTAIKLAKQMAQAYYGRDVQRSYWQGFSGGGHMGMTQVQNCPEEYDGLLIGAPAMHWQQFRLQDSWAAMINRKAQLLGDPFTTGQLNAATSAAISYCMTRGTGGVNIGGQNILHDPRSCDWNATMNVCGAANAPAAPNCLTPQKATLLNQTFDGPRNAYGKLAYYPYSHGVNISASTTPIGATAQVMRWNHFDAAFSATNSLFADAESIALAGSPANAISFVDEMFLSSTRTSDYADASNAKIDGAKAKGLKIMMYHGTHDSAILFRKAPAYYREVATHFGNGTADYASLQSWYRFYLVPGMGHSGQSWLPQLIDWVENGAAPDSITRTGGMPLVCPYPQFAQYDGSGPTNSAASYTCGGDLESNTTALCSMVKTQYKGEKGPITNTVELGIDPRKCQARPAPTAR